jgi:hypothetical protein
LVKAHFLRRADVPPLPDDVPVDEIARWLAQLIEQDGHLAHSTAALLAFKKYGHECTYSEPDKRRYRSGKLYYPYPHKCRFHPDILWALKKLTGKSVIWEKDCRGWHKRKSPASGLVSADH